MKEFQFCNDSEKLVEHGIHYLPCSYTSDALDPLPKQLWRNTDFKMMSSGCHSAKVLSTTFGYSLVAMITDLCRHLTYTSKGAWHTLYAMLPSIIREMLPEIHTMKKFDFLKLIIHSQIICNAIIHVCETTERQVITFLIRLKMAILLFLY